MYGQCSAVDFYVWILLWVRRWFCVIVKLMFVVVGEDTRDLGWEVVKNVEKVVGIVIGKGFEVDLLILVSMNLILSLDI